MPIQDRIREIRRKLPSEVRLVLITKQVPLASIEEAFRAGVRDFGENRVQELLEKQPRLPSEIRWHFVGRLQTNKVKSLLTIRDGQGRVPLLHSLDRPDLARALQKEADKQACDVEALFQVNATGEAAKAGFRPDEMEAALRDLKDCPRIRLRGFMTIGPTPGAGAPDRNEIRACFRRVAQLKNEMQSKFPALDLRHLSMGMSSDFDIAVQEGATLVRIGTAVFGERSSLRAPTPKGAAKSAEGRNNLETGWLHPPTEGSQ